jgi:hypothetical protein
LKGLILKVVSLKNMSSIFVLRGVVLLATAFVLSGAAFSQTTPQTDGAAAPHGTVLFNRDQDSATDAKKPDAVAQQSAAAAQPPIAPVTDAERESLVFTAYDLDVHLAPALRCGTLERRL